MSPTTNQLTGIDAEGLQGLRDKALADPSTGHKKVRVTTVCDGGFDNLSFVRDLEPMRVSEPPQLLGENTAPNPTEAALAALGSCISVGLLANATHAGVTLSKIEVEMEGDIDISAVWGVGDTPEDKRLGVSAVRANVTLAGDADEATLQQITDQAIRWSPVVNTFTNPVAFAHQLTVD